MGEFIRGKQLAAAEITNRELAPGALSADATGRAIIATGFFDSTTVLDKFVAGSIADSVLTELYIKANGTRPFTGNQSMGGFNLQNLAAPLLQTDAATKDYVDAVAQGFTPHAACRVATTAVLATNTYVNRFEVVVVSLTGLNVGDTVDDTLGNTGTIYAINVTTKEVQITVTLGTWGLTGTFHDSTTSNTTTYTNGVYGPGSTLTSTTNVSINNPGIDGVTTLVVNDRILVKNEAAPEHNGIYFVLQVGSVSLPYILQRAEDFDETTGSHPDMSAGSTTWITSGNVNANTGWVLTTSGTIIVGTTAINWSQFAATTVYTFRNGLVQTGSFVDVTSPLGTLTSTPGSVEVTFATPSTMADATAPLQGTANSSLRSDAKIQVSTGTPSTTVKTDSTTASTGTAATLLRTDAQLIILTAAPTAASVISDAGSPAQGTSTSSLRADATFTALTAVPVAIGTANAQGTSTSLARANHVHKGFYPSKNNLGLIANNTANADNQLATASTLVGFPVYASRIDVLTNGIRYSVGDGTKVGVSYYFSTDGGVTALAFSALVGGESLYFNRSVAGFRLDTSDKIDILFENGA